MFGLAPSELLIIVVVALVCVGPSDLPRALKTAAKWMNAGRKLAREFQGHVDELVREAELDELRDQAKKLTSPQGLASHLESIFDPDQELAKALPPDGLVPAFENTQGGMALPETEQAALAASSESMLPGFVPPASTEPVPVSVAAAVEAEEQMAVHTAVPKASHVG